MKAMVSLFGWFKPWKRSKDTEKFKKKYKHFAKAQIIEVIKIISYYLINMYFYFTIYL